MSLSKLSNELVIYTTLAIAGIIFFSKNILFKNGEYKTIEKKKKNTLKKFRNFFILFKRKLMPFKIVNRSDIDSNSLNSEDKYNKIKKIIDQLTREPEKVKDEKDNLLDNKKDRIFNYLLNNMSRLIINENK